MTRIAYRIEDIKGGGPYSGPNTVGLSLKYSPYRHPVLEDEGCEYDHCDRFGFASMKQLTEWFDADLLKILATPDPAEFYLTAYSVGDDFVISDTQMAFCEDTSDFLARISLDEAFPDGFDKPFSAVAVGGLFADVAELQGWSVEDRSRTATHDPEDFLYD